MRNKSALMTGVLAGLSSPGSFASPVEYPQPKGSDLGRMRSDAVRVGRDFSTVIRRENGKQKHANKASAKGLSES